MKYLYSQINQYAKADGAWGAFVNYGGPKEGAGDFTDEDGEEFVEIPFDFNIDNVEKVNTGGQVERVIGGTDATGDFIYNEPEGDERVDSNHRPTTQEGDPEGSRDNSGDMQEPPERNYRKNGDEDPTEDIWLED